MPFHVEITPEQLLQRIGHQQIELELLRAEVQRLEAREQELEAEVVRLQQDAGQEPA